MRIFECIKNIFFALILLQIAPLLIKNVIKIYSNLLEPKARVALISLRGDLDDATPVTNQLHTYFKDPAIKAIVLKIDSAGSACGTSEAIYEEIIYLKARYQKPIITLAENVCGSGAYLIACATDSIVASGMSLIGNIGICFTGMFQLHQLIEQYDVGSMPLATRSHKSTGNSLINITADQKAIVQKYLDNTYDQFTLTVAKQRKLSTTNLKEWANGKMFTGKEALELGLVDFIGSESTATNIVKERAMIEGEIEWVRKQQPLSMITKLFSEEETDHETSGLQGAVHTLLLKLATIQATNGEAID